MRGGDWPETRQGPDQEGWFSILENSNVFHISYACCATIENIKGLFKQRETGSDLYVTGAKKGFLF